MAEPSNSALIWATADLLNEKRTALISAVLTDKIDLRKAT